MTETTMITVAEAKKIILALPKGRMFTMEFVRATPKCTKCDYKSKKLWQTAFDNCICPKCGGVISRTRWTRAQLGVSNPKSALKPGEGLFEGESFEHALQDNRLKFFDMDALNDAGGLGDYRQCRIENIMTLNANGEKYRVEAPKTEDVPF